MRWRPAPAARSSRRRITDRPRPFSRRACTPRGRHGVQARRLNEEKECDMRRLTLAFGLLALLAVAASSPAPDPARVEAAGLHNVFRLMPNLYSGSSPDNEEGFRSLQKLG